MIGQANAASSTWQLNLLRTHSNGLEIFTNIFLGTKFPLTLFRGKSLVARHEGSLSTIETGTLSSGSAC